MARLPRSVWLPLIVAFVAAALTAHWIGGHKWRGLTLGPLILIACSAALVPVFVATLAMQLFRSGTKTGVREACQLFALRLAWLGPLTIWLASSSLLAAPCAALITMLLASSAWRYYGAVEPRWTFPSTHYFLAFPMGASLLIQSAAITGVMGWTSTACVFATLAALCIAARRFQATDPWAAPKPPWVHVTASVFAAIFCSALGLLHYLELGRGVLATASSNRRQTITDPSLSSGGGFRGVILRPKETKRVTLIPPLPQLHRTFGIGSPNPLSIPFYGVYWIFRNPDRRPPPHAYETNGTLLDRNFRSSDSYTLQFEAHQNLGSSIDLACCTAIAIEVRHQDRHPLPISLQLTLSDGTGPAPRNLNLGLQTISLINTDGVISERLTYPIPVARVIPRFDGFHIRFQIDYFRRNVSPKVAIDRFLLIPRG